MDLVSNPSSHWPLNDLNQVIQLLRHSIISSVIQASLGPAVISRSYIRDIVSKWKIPYLRIYSFSISSLSLLIAAENFARELVLDLNRGWNYLTWAWFSPLQIGMRVHNFNLLKISEMFINKELIAYLSFSPVKDIYCWAIALLNLSIACLCLVLSFLKHNHPNGSKSELCARDKRNEDRVLGFIFQKDHNRKILAGCCGAYP